MRIISPVDNLKEAKGLLEAGADELYGGYVPESWSRYRLLASLNQRTFPTAQIPNRDEVAETIKLAHDFKKSFALTLNAPFYTDEQLPLLVDYVGDMLQLGIDSVILADTGLLRVLKRHFPALEFHASTLAHLSNAGSVKFMAGQGVQRVVLPRHLTVTDMATIVDKVPEVKFDAFLLVGKCPNTEGLCTFHHSSPDKIWPCEISYQMSSLREEGGADLLDALRRQGCWAETNRRHGCGLCAIPHLQKAGISGLKLVGRGAPAAQKIKNILLTKDFISLAETCPDDVSYRTQAMTAHRERFGAACHQNVCYYPEFFYGGEI
jgi:putative protease